MLAVSSSEKVNLKVGRLRNLVLADVSSLDLAEQARMLMHPTPPKREE